MCFFITLYTDPNEVVYFFNGNAVTSSTPGFNITDEGLIVDDPANTFTDGEQGTCVVSSQSINNAITINFLVFNSPSITPDTNQLDITEGNSTTLTCIRDSANTNSDQYRWTRPDGSFSPPQPASSPIDLILTTINRDESGLYVCTGTRPGTSETVNATITINVEYPPKVLSFTPTNTTVVAGSTVTLNCSYEGNPSPTVSWSHNDTMLDPKSDPNLSETLNDGYTLLEVTFANINDTGVYKCEIDNIFGMNSSEVFFNTLQVAPGPVATLQSDSNTDVCVTFSWSFGFNGNAPITGVYITYTATSNYGMSQGGDQTGTASTNTKDTTSITICNLQPLTTYEFSVSVENTVSNTVGRSSVETISVTTLPSVPNQPTIESLNDVSSTEIRVNWMGSTIDTFTQTAINSYIISYKAVGDSTVSSVIVMDGEATSQLLLGLMKGTIYEVTMVAGNSAGKSLPSEPLNKRTAVDSPSAVTNLVPTSNPFSICVQWAEPIDNGGQPIEQYRVELFNRDVYPTENYVFVTDLISSVMSYTIENLNNDTDYSVRVSASNDEAGFGTIATVNVVTGTTLLVDPNFTVSVSMVTAISAQIDWTVPEVNDNIQYRLQIKKEAERDFDPDQYTVFTSSVRTTSLSNLSPNISYDLRMTRIEGGGCTRRVTEIEGFETLVITTMFIGPSFTSLSNAISTATPTQTGSSVGLQSGLGISVVISIIQLVVIILLIVYILYSRHKDKTPTTDTVKSDTVQYDTIEISTDHSIHTTSNVAYEEVK